MNMIQPDLDELLEPGPRYAGQDVLSTAIGSDAFSHHHTLGLSQNAVGYPLRLRVSRFYFMADPKVAVDLEREAGEPYEREAKAAWCAGRGWRYVVVKDAFDVAAFAGTVDADAAPRPPVRKD